MKVKMLWLSLLCFALGIGNARASIIGTTDPTQFTDPVDWCVQYGCSGQQLATPQPWSSVAGNTGLVGLVGTQQGFYVLQQDVTWGGNFADHMGLIYNGSAFGNTPTDIAATFDQGLYGAGAWIQSDYYGPFTATIDLFDSSYQLLGSFTTSGTSNNAPGTALFIGGYISTPDVWAVQFDATGTGPSEPDFAIGTMNLDTTSPVPEPSTLVLLGPSLLGWLAFARRRMARKPKEVLQ
ncbi:MAG TPA: PEP-CTERM sorting domain-containing protein [Terriglobia bacterium]|nr:PEP-CTERM sorting domain-containing protein [Terriglobia bacterium]